MPYTNIHVLLQSVFAWDSVALGLENVIKSGLLYSLAPDISSYNQSYLAISNKVGLFCQSDIHESITFKSQIFSNELYHSVDMQPPNNSTQACIQAEILKDGVFWTLCIDQVTPLRTLHWSSIKQLIYLK